MRRTAAKRKQRSSSSNNVKEEEEEARKTTRPPPAKRRAKQPPQQHHHPWGYFGLLPIELVQTELKRWLPPEDVAVFYGATCATLRKALYGRELFFDCASLPVVVLEYETFKIVARRLGIGSDEEYVEEEEEEDEDDDDDDDCYHEDINTEGEESDDDDDDDIQLDEHGFYRVNYHAYEAEYDSDAIHAGDEDTDDDTGDDYIRFWSGAIHIPRRTTGVQPQQSHPIPVMLRLLRNNEDVADEMKTRNELKKRIVELRDVYDMAVKAIDLPLLHDCQSMVPYQHELTLHRDIPHLLIELAVDYGIYIDWIRVEGHPDCEDENETDREAWLHALRDARLPLPPAPAPTVDAQWNKEAIDAITTTIYVERVRDELSYALESGDVADNRLYWRATQLSRTLPNCKVVLDPVRTMSGWVETLTIAAAAEKNTTATNGVIIRELCLLDRRIDPENLNARWLPITEPQDAQLAAMKAAVRRDKTALALPVLLYSPNAHNRYFTNADPLDARVFDAWRDLAAEASRVLLSTFSVTTGRAPGTVAHAKELGHVLDPYVTHIYFDVAHCSVFRGGAPASIEKYKPRALETRLARYPNARGLVWRNGMHGDASAVLAHLHKVAQDLGFTRVTISKQRAEIVVEWPTGPAPTAQLARLIKNFTPLP
jgi:hypothetical protein